MPKNFLDIWSEKCKKNPTRPTFFSPDKTFFSLNQLVCTKSGKFYNFSYFTNCNKSTLADGVGKLHTHTFCFLASSQCKNATSTMQSKVGHCPSSLKQVFCSAGCEAIPAGKNSVQIFFCHLGI